MKTALASTALMLALLGTQGMAQGMDGMGHGGQMGAGMLPDFATLDADADGQVTSTEVDAHMAARFAAADTDGSGGLSVAEAVAMTEAMRVEAMTARMTERLQRIDDNADGEVQAEEFQARMPQTALLFDHLDTDNSGGISTEEFEEGHAQMNERRGGRHDGMRGGHHDGDGRGWMFWRNGSE
jgi:hypothetical protein